MSTNDLRRKAEAATPGPWSADNTLGGAVAFGPDGDSVAVARGNPAIAPDRVITAEQNADYIAAANPQAVLAILDELDHLRGEADRVAGNAVDLLTSGCTKHRHLSFPDFVEQGGGACSLCLTTENKQLRTERDLLATALGGLVNELQAAVAKGVNLGNIGMALADAVQLMEKHDDPARAAEAEGRNQ